MGEALSDTRRVSDKDHPQKGSVQHLAKGWIMDSTWPAWAIPAWILGAPFVLVAVETMRARRAAKR
jgi:hypothetical protein